MATNNRPLKAYVRYDGSGRAVSSSLIWRKNKPKVGNWKEVQGYECCVPSACSEINMRITFNRYSAPECIGFIDSNDYFVTACNGQFKIGTATTPSLPIPDGYYNALGFDFNVYVENSIVVAKTAVCA